MATRASDTRPTKRIMESQYDQFVVEISSRVIAIRPKGCRRLGPANVEVAIGQLYQRLLLGRKSAKKGRRA